MLVNAVIAIPDLALFACGLVFPSIALLLEAETNVLALVAANLLDQNIVRALSSFFSVAFTTVLVLELFEWVIIKMPSVTTEYA